MKNERVSLYALVGLAALARLLLQVAALPPYAGLDEVWHVSRLAFVRAEGRNPDKVENSVPRYVASSIANDPAFPADFGHIAERWPEVVRTRAVLVDHAVEVKPYLRTNVEAQQPRLYYSVVARLCPHLSQLGELRFWRLLSVLFGVVIALATARIGETFFGLRGIAAAALLVSLPTWETLVARVSNDGFACMWLALALMCTFAETNVILEAICWALALATKLYTWPALVVLLMRRRRPLVYIACAASMAVTVFDLATRTHNPVGVLGFDPAARTAAPVPIRYFEMIKITLASGIWTSGPHFDALTLRGMLLYAAPMLGILLFGAVRGLGVSRSRGLDDETARPRDLATVPAALAAFAAAQAVHAYGYIRRARAIGLALPVAGKEGWFWYALAPLVVALIFPMTPIVLLAVWVVGWDVILTEGALFHDFAGVTSPASPTWLFRWGPWHAPFTADLSRVAVGPFASHLIALRLIHLAAVAGVFVLESLLHDRNAHTSR
jgi:hypothetical protein